MPEFELLDNGTKVAVSADFRFTRDSLLLARFARVRNDARLLELCSGCGIISLALYDSGHRGPVTCVELSPRGTELLECSLRLGGITSFRPVTADIKAFSESTKYDAAVCNPPYFETGAKSPDPMRAAARHGEACGFSDVVAAAKRNLREGGGFFFCMRPVRLQDVCAALEHNDFSLKRLQFVRSRADGPARLALFEARYRAGAGAEIAPDLITV